MNEKEEIYFVDWETMTEAEQEANYNKREEDRKNGFPLYRESVASLSFKERVVEFFNLSDSDIYEKSKIIYYTFTERQQDIFEEKYIKTDKVLREMFALIVDKWTRAVQFKGYAENYIRDVLIHERNAKWFNTIIKDIEDALSDLKQENSTDTLFSILQNVKSYRSPQKEVVVSINKGTGTYEVDSSVLGKHIINDIAEIYEMFSDVKAYFVDIRSFLESRNQKHLFPNYLKVMERDFKHFNTMIPECSTLEGKEIKKIPKKNRTPEQKYLLDKIEANERRGYIFPDYTDVTPNENIIKSSRCNKIWKEITK